MGLMMLTSNLVLLLGEPAGGNGRLRAAMDGFALNGLVPLERKI